MKHLIVLTTLMLLFGCGGTTSETTGLSPEEETVLADSLAGSLAAEQAELSQVTQESVQEIDSLLENL